MDERDIIRGLHRLADDLEAMVQDLTSGEDQKAPAPPEGKLLQLPLERLKA
jgi:hypothetical protein